MGSKAGSRIDTLVEQYGARVMGLLRGILNQEEDAQDAYQETWFSLWKATARIQWNRDPWPFIRKTAVRKAIDRIRSTSRLGQRERAIDLELAAPCPRETPDIDLATLNREERVCLALFFWEGYSVAEIATELAVPKGTIKTWMFRARGKLRETLAQTQTDDSASN